MTHESNQNKKKYSCPMHLEVQSDQPATCSKCGMKLVEKDKCGKQKLNRT